MKRFLKDNYVLVSGIALPLVLALVFFLATQVRVGNVPPPRTGIVFAVNYAYGARYNTNGLATVAVDAPGWRLVVRNGVLYAAYRKPRKGQMQGATPEIHLYDPVTDADRTLPLPEVKGIDLNETPIDGLQDVKLDTATKSPEGYRFARNGRNDGNLITALFGGADLEESNTYILYKDGIRKPVTAAPYNSTFIGWAVK